VFIAQRTQAEPARQYAQGCFQCRLYTTPSLCQQNTGTLGEQLNGIDDNTTDEDRFTTAL